MSSVASTALKMAGLGGVEQWSLGVGRSLVDSLRLMALLGIIVMSTTDGPGNVYAMIPPDDGMVEDGGGGS